MSKATEFLDRLLDMQAEVEVLLSDKVYLYDLNLKAEARSESMIEIINLSADFQAIERLVNSEHFLRMNSDFI